MLCRDCIHNRPALDMTQRPACAHGRDAEVVQGYGCIQHQEIKPCCAETAKTD